MADPRYADEIGGILIDSPYARVMVLQDHYGFSDQVIMTLLEEADSPAELLDLVQEYVALWCVGADR